MQLRESLYEEYSVSNWTSTANLNDIINNLDQEQLQELCSSYYNNTNGTSTTSATAAVNDDNDYIDLYDYWSCLKRVDLGGKVKIREHAEFNTSEYLHAYNFASKAKTFAGVIQFQERDSKDKKWKLDASVTWNFKQEPFTLKFELE